MNNDFQLIEQQTKTQRQLDDIYIPEQQTSLVAPFLDLPGLVGLWYPGNVQRSTGNIYDSSGQGRTLTYNGNPTINYTNTGIAYADLDGTGDYWNRADESDLDVLGTESWAANPGLTIGVWARPQTTGTLQNVIGKANDFSGSFMLVQEADDDVLFRIRDSTDASTDNISITDAFINTNVWGFYVGRFIPSTEITVWYNTQSNSDSSSIYASLLNGADSFGFGALGTGSNPFNGDIPIGFLCASALSDAAIQSLFQQTRSLFGV